MTACGFRSKSFSNQTFTAMHDHEIAMCAYVQLAVISDEKQQAPTRDRFLILATNSAHQLKRFATMADARRDPDFQKLVAKWEKYCPFEQAEHLLTQLGRAPEGDQLDVPRGERMLQILSDFPHGHRS
jgi:hypothetical protein